MHIYNVGTKVKDASTKGSALISSLSHILWLLRRHHHVVIKLAPKWIYELVETHISSKPYKLTVNECEHICEELDTMIGSVFLNCNANKDILAPLSASLIELRKDVQNHVKQLNVKRSVEAHRREGLLIERYEASKISAQPMFPLAHGNKSLILLKSPTFIPENSIYSKLVADLKSTSNALDLNEYAPTTDEESKRARFFHCLGGGLPFPCYLYNYRTFSNVLGSYRFIFIAAVDTSHLQKNDYVD